MALGSGGAADVAQERFLEGQQAERDAAAAAASPAVGLPVPGPPTPSVVVQKGEDGPLTADEEAPLEELTDEQKFQALVEFQESLVSGRKLVPDAVVGTGQCAAVAEATNVVLDVLRIAPRDVTTVRWLIERLRQSIDTIRNETTGAVAELAEDGLAETDALLGRLSGDLSYEAMAREVLTYLGAGGRLVDLLMRGQVQQCPGIAELYTGDWVDLLVIAIESNIS